MVRQTRRQRPVCACGRIHEGQEGLCGLVSQPSFCVPTDIAVARSSLPMAPSYPPVPKVRAEQIPTARSIQIAGSPRVLTFHPSSFDRIAPSPAAWDSSAAASSRCSSSAAPRVVAFDIFKPEDAGDDPRIVWMQGDLTNPDDVDKACEDGECVWHIAALVEPYHALDTHGLMKVNYQGTVNVIDACKKHGIKKIVIISSPSPSGSLGNDINGLKETELKIPRKFLQAYAESKCKGEACMAACDGENLLTVAVAPSNSPRPPR